jgi:hypothetical protein
MTRTTPPRPVDVAGALPQLAPLARPAVRLHPRPGAPSRGDSSVGGPLLWPAGEPWPYCDGPHDPYDLTVPTSPEDVRLDRRIRAAALSRPHDNPYHPPFTPEELETLRRIQAGRPWPEGPAAMLPVAQLYLRDVPVLRPPGHADVLQVLWCPFDHGGLFPETVLYWRSAAEITSVLTDPPEPAAVQYEWYLPEPCLLHPEQVTEYPNPLELSEDLQELVGRWSARQAGAAVADRREAIGYASGSDELYWNALSIAPGWKAGGWSRWGRTDPVAETCPACDSVMVPLLTIASTEWDGDKRSWIPYEDQDRTEPSASWLDPVDPAMIRIGDGDTLQLYVCPVDPGHPHTARLQ